MEEEPLSNNHGKWSRKKLETARSLPEAPRRHLGGIQEAPRMLPRDTQEAPRKLPGGSQEAPRRQPGQSRLQEATERGQGNFVLVFTISFCTISIYFWLLRGVFERPMILDAFLQAYILPGSRALSVSNQGPLYNTVKTPIAKASLGNIIV